MTLEEILLTGAFTLVGVYLGFWLSTRETRKSRQERERKLRRLIVSEVSDGIVIPHLVTWLIELMEISESRPDPHDPILELMNTPVATTVYDSIALDPTIVSTDIFERFTQWHGLITFSIRAKMAWLIGHQVEKATLPLIDLVRSSATLAEAAGMGLLLTLGAKQEIKEFDDLKEQLDPIIAMLRQLRENGSNPKE